MLNEVQKAMIVLESGVEELQAKKERPKKKKKKKKNRLLVLLDDDGILRCYHHFQSLLLFTSSIQYSNVGHENDCST